MVLLTVVIWLRMYVERSTQMRALRIHPQKVASASQMSSALPDTRAADNFRNLFEVPVLFYALALFLFVTNRVDALYLAAAWVFVAFRAAHSLVHCTFNHVLLRFSLYLVAAVAVWFMLVRAALDYFAA